MKWNILVGSMVLGASLCGQSFGGDLLHRLLGGNGCGARSSCCDTSVCDPTCGAEIAACDPCGAPACDSGCGIGKRHGGLLGKLFGHKKGCDEVACDACPSAG
ncbi:MAG: hypothetical protein ACK57P_15565, partial [Planctomycetota bacterium]